MALFFRRGKYSPRAYVLALFIILAVILGGGGTPNPLTEMILEFVFAAFALVWLWTPRDSAIDTAVADPLVFVLVVVLLLVPVVQLIPLPPSVWTRLPGRESEVAALSLIDAQSAWRPISLSPSHTIASLLALVPPTFCILAVGQLSLSDRRLVLLAIAVMAIVTALLGAAQLTAGHGGISFYPEHHVGWVIGFQANRNATADVLLIGMLSLAVLAAPYLAGARRKIPLNLSRRALAGVVGGTVLLLLAATAMTGSRAGIALVVVAAVGISLIFALVRGSGGKAITASGLAIVVLALAGLAVVFFSLSQGSALARATVRFADLHGSRGAVWQDSWYALKQYWPAGFGMGGFESAMLPAERLEALDVTLPNRAHNDYLEIGLEGGALGYFLVLVGMIVCITMAYRAWSKVPNARPQVVFGTTVLILIGLHSAVDYPLRSMAVACLAGVAGGMLVRKGVSTHRQTLSGGVDEVKGLA